MKKTILTILLTLVILAFVTLSMGAGHGTNLFAKIFYPFTMIIAILSKNGIGFFPTILAIVQVPIYALIPTRKPKWKYYLIGVHIISVIICFNLTTENFSG